eukprot:gene19055-biopygen16021
MRAHIHRHKATDPAFEPDDKLLSVTAEPTNARSIAIRQSVLCQWQIVNPAEHNRSSSGCETETGRL